MEESPPGGSAADRGGLSKVRRRELKALANRLAPVASLAAGPVSPGVIQTLRHHLSQQPVAKVRVQGDRHEADETALELTRHVPCVLVDRVGSVLLLTREPLSENEPGD